MQAGAVILLPGPLHYLCLPCHQQSPFIGPQWQLNLHRSCISPGDVKTAPDHFGLFCRASEALASPVSSSLDNKPDGVQKPLAKISRRHLHF